MEILGSLTALFRHMEWADGAVWGAMLDAPAAAGDRVGLTRLHHIHTVQRAFLDVWREREFVLPSDDDPLASDPIGLARWGREYHAEAAEYVSSLSADDLDRPIVVPWTKMVESVFGRSIDTPTLGETLQQVAMHTAYHRGQVSSRLRELGGEPPLTDFIAWVWLGKPAPRWPDALTLSQSA